MAAFMHVVSISRDSLRKILLLGDFREYPEDKQMHCTARLVEFLNSYASNLQNCAASDAKKDFLLEEIAVLEEAKCIGLPNFMPRSAFLTILQEKVKDIASMPIDFVHNVWNYLQTVLVSVFKLKSAHYYQLQVSTRRALDNLVAKKRKKSIEHVMEVVEMEKLTDYTCSPEYLEVYNKLMSHQSGFLNQVYCSSRPNNVILDGVGEIYVVTLRDYDRAMLSQAFDLKARMISYWKIVVKRLIDNIALHLMFSINELVNNELLKEICNDLLSSSGGIERLLEESPAISVHYGLLIRRGEEEYKSHVILLLKL